MSENEKWEPVEPLIDPEESEKGENPSLAEIAMKRHYDYYMDESRPYNPFDQAQIDLALKRARAGLIRHIPILPSDEEM